MVHNQSDTNFNGRMIAVADGAIDMGLAALDAAKSGMIAAIVDLNAEWLTEAEALAEHGISETTSVDPPAISVAETIEDHSGR